MHTAVLAMLSCHRTPEYLKTFFDGLIGFIGNPRKHAGLQQVHSLTLVCSLPYGFREQADINRFSRSCNLDGTEDKD
jgi:hypothetical protein